MAVKILKRSEIARRFIQTFLANQGEIRDVLPLTPEHDLIEAVFAQGSEDLYRALALVQDDFYIKTATGDALDLRADDFGLERAVALAARGEATFTGSAGSTIPAGTRIRRPVVSGSDAVSYTTDVSATIPVAQTQIIIPVTAEIEGTIGNAAPLTITEFSAGAPAGITTVMNAKAFDSGRDRETDDELRQAIYDFFTSLTRGTLQSIEFAARRIGGVFRADFLENTPSAGQGILYLDTGSNTATDNIRDAVKSVILGDGSSENRGYLPAGTKIRVIALTGTAYDDAVEPAVADPTLQRFNIAIYTDEAA